MSGIDWEGILDAEGAAMQDAYDALVYDAMEDMDSWDCGDVDLLDETSGWDDIEAVEMYLDGFSARLQNVLQLVGQRLPSVGEFREEIARVRQDSGDAEVEAKAYNIQEQIEECRNAFFDQLADLFPELEGHLNKKAQQKKEAALKDAPLPFG